MAFESTRQYTLLQQAGLYQRLAHSFHAPLSETNRPRLTGEEAARTALLKELRKQHQIAEDDYSESALTTLIQALYMESDALLFRQIESNFHLYRGEKLSDIYSVIVPYDPKDRKLSHRLREEAHSIETTVMYPDQQEVSFLEQGRLAIRWVKLYVRAYPSSHIPYTLLVLGEVTGRSTKVLRAVRYYPETKEKLKIETSLLKTMLVVDGLNLTVDKIAAQLLEYNPQATVVGIYDDTWVWELYQADSESSGVALASLITVTDLGSFVREDEVTSS